jgi:HPt (histidine-containing phosphotransfer) domain-containing protein
MVKNDPDGADAAEMFDKVELLSRVEGDRELLSEIVREFLQDYPRLLALARDAIAAADGDVLARAAHTLKGSAANFAAKSVTEAVVDLETIACRRDLSGAEEAYSALEGRLERLARALAALVEVQHA